MSPFLYNVVDYGARGVAVPAETLRLEHLHFKWLVYPEGTSATIYRPSPGSPYDSVGIQKAIDAAHSSGGGTVLVPAGDYLIGPIELKSRVQLHLEPGSRLWASPAMEDYLPPPNHVFPPFSHSRDIGRIRDRMSGKLHLISGNGAEDIAITGMGQISGQSAAFVIPWMNTCPAHSGALQRPSDTFLFHDCRRVRIEGIRVLDTPCWSIVFDVCRRIQVRGVDIHSFDVINSDGIDLVNTSDVTISDCQLHVTDDAICLKNMTPDSTMRNIAITNCVIRTLCNAVKIGTETIGNFEDIAISNLVIYNPAEDPRGGKGICLAAVDGGQVSNVSINQIVMRNVSCAFYLALGRRAERQEPHRTPRSSRMEGVTISNLRAEGTQYTSFLAGLPDQPLKDVMLSNIHIRKDKGFYTEPPSSSVMDHPEAYPSPVMFGSLEEGDQLPAWGLYLRHAENVFIRDLVLGASAADVRKCLEQEFCRSVRIAGMNVMMEQSQLTPAL